MPKLYPRLASQVLVIVACTVVASTIACGPETSDEAAAPLMEARAAVSATSSGLSLGGVLSLARTVRPFVDCVDGTSAPGRLRVRFGYQSVAAAAWQVPVGLLNSLVPPLEGGSPPTILSPGLHAEAFVVEGPGPVAWWLAGNLALATRRSPTCARPLVCPPSCDDGNPCTADHCGAETAFACVHAPVADGASCSDGNACTTGDACQAGLCASGPAVVCPSSDGCHPGLCDGATGQCATLQACTLLGTGAIPGTSRDGLAVSPPVLEDGTPHDQIGGIGSAIAYTGQGQLYLMAPDRGPAAGADSFSERYYLVDIGVSAGRVTPTLRGGAPLVPAKGAAPFTGRDTAFDLSNPAATQRLDVEGLRVGASGTFFVSDEYGPFLYEMSAAGERLRALPVPPKFLVTNPGIEDAELPPTNTSGRQANRGMEGLAISPDGRLLYGIMQSPLLQDGALDASNGRVGVNVRLLELDVETGATRELVYPLEKASYGINEILAIDDHRFLVLERDGKAGKNAAFKRLYAIDISGASDVSAVPSLPSTGLPDGVNAVKKSLFLDLLDPAFGLAGASAPEKIEGLTFGPDLPDGRRLLLVTIDNDFVTTQDNTILAFAIDPRALPGFVAQAASFPRTCADPVITCAAAGPCFAPGTCNPGDGSCASPALAAGALAGDQLAGDCAVQVCDGAGHLVSRADDTDVADDGLACTSDECSGGVPSHVPVAAGRLCAAGLCDGRGACVACLTAGDCPGQDGACQARTCVDGACGVVRQPRGTPVLSQIVGDCSSSVCDGAGGETLVVDDGDRPDDANPCTDDLCRQGVPSHAPLAEGVSCGGDKVCDGAGACVGCVVASDCPGSDGPCQVRACTAGVCGTSNSAAGTPLSTQTTGDCRRAVCDGSGNVTSVFDDGDVPASPGACLVVACAAGQPLQTPAPAGVACAGDGASTCDGTGRCLTPSVRVVRVGDGTSALSSAATPVFIEERGLDGALLGTVALPVAAAGGQLPFALSGSADSEGGLALAADGHSLALAGYAAVPGLASVASTTAAAFPRVVARVDAANQVDTSTVVTGAFNANNVRGAVSADGSGFWVAGAGGATGGVWYAPWGQAAAIQVLASPTSVRWPAIMAGQLYASASSGNFVSVLAVGSGLVVTPGLLATSLPGLPVSGSSSPFGYVFLDLDGLPGPELLYVADDRTAAKGGGVQRWRAGEGGWVLSATLNVGVTPVGFRGLTGFAAGGKAVLLATTADAATNRLVLFRDDGLSSPASGAVIGSSPVGTLYRGVALSPR